MVNTPTATTPPKRDRPLRKLTLTDGSVVHIVHSHEEAEELKRANSGQSINYHFHGSPEHLDSLKKIHDHHSGQASILREKNPEVHDAMDGLRHEMDKVAREMEKLTKKPVELEANFDRFGYSAHIRTHGADEEKGGMDDGSDGSMVDGAIAAGIQLRKDGGRRKTTTMKFYQKPVLRQYFHNGLLYRAQEIEEVASFELFVDLLYVGIIAINGDMATENPTGTGLLRFAVTMIASWKIWSDIGTLVSQFETDDIVQRVSILFILACLVGFTTNIVAAFESTWSQLIAFYLGARIAAILVMAWCAFVLPNIRPIMTMSIVVTVIPTILWLGSIWVDEPQRQALIWVAIAFDIWGNFISIFLIRGSRHLSTSFHKRMVNLFSYFPAVNIEHKTERMGAFVSLVFGYSVIALLYQNHASFGMNAFFGKAILALVQAYCFNWIYFDIDGSHHHVHAIRRHALSSSVWLTAHLPFIMSFTLSGAALSRLVVAHDVDDADPETLTEVFAHRSEEHIPDGLRWFYCCGLGVALICMAMIAATHVHTPVESQRLRKRTRLAIRCCIGFAWIFLPFAKHLDSLQLIYITTIMTVFALAVDIYGTSCVGDSFIDNGEHEQKYDRQGGLSRTQSLAPSVGESTMVQQKEGGLMNYLVKHM